MKMIKNLSMASLAITILFFISCTDDETTSGPVIENQTFSLEEKSSSGTLVGKVNASSSNQESLTFSIIDGNTSGGFTIDSDDGELYVADSEILDFDANPTFSLGIQVEAGGSTSSATITINLTEVTENAAPVINDQAFSIDENSSAGTEVGIVVATDAEGDDLSFSIVSGNVGDAFTIDTFSGVIAVAEAVVLDYETTPTYALVVEVLDGSSAASATVTITIDDIEIEPLQSEEDIISSLEGISLSLNQYIEFVYLFDAIYSNGSSSPGGAWDNVYNHTVITTDAQVDRLWSDAYSIIYNLNNILSSLESLSLDTQVADEYTARALGMRGYLFFTLVKWFDNIPLELSTSSDMTASSSKADVLVQATSDFNTAIISLPSTWPAGEEDKITKGFVQQVLARVEAESFNWASALSQSEGLINGGQYTLSLETSSFSQSSDELLWGFDATGNTEFNDFFLKGSFIPVARYTETLLIYAEASLQMGNLVNAINTLNQVNLRSGVSALDLSASQNEISTGILAGWERELPQEGEIFSSLRRFGEAASRFSIEEVRLVLPIPQSAIDTNQNLFQNPGY